MTAQNPRSPKSRSRMVLACGIAAGLALLILLGVAVVLLARTWLSRGELTAWIKSPETDQKVQLDRPVAVLAGAGGRAGMSRVEVYADGALILAQDSSGQGESQLNLVGNWVPITAGRHALTARGYAARDEFADSNVVYVDVLPAPASVVIDVDSLPHEAGAANPSLDVLAKYLGTTPDDLRGRNPSLGGIASGDPLPSGSHVEGPNPPRPPHEPSSPPAPRTGTPAAPSDVGGTAGCTSAVLTWRASPDAQTYRVYRLGTDVSRIADGLRTTTYTDALPAAGTYVYQIASVRNGQEGRSLMFSVSTPAGCARSACPSGTSCDLVLTLATVETDSNWEGLYCFLWINRQGPDRFPAGSDWVFLAPEASNPRDYNLTHLPHGGQVDLTGQPLSSPVTLSGDCIGRTEPTVHDPNPSIGTFSVSHPQAQWDGTLRSARGDGFRFDYCLGPSTRPCTPTAGGGTPSGGETFLFPVPHDVRRAESAAACGDLPLAEQWPCASAGIVCSTSLCLPLHTVDWLWEASPLFPESSLTGYTVFLDAYSVITGGTVISHSWDVNPRYDLIVPKRFLAQERDVLGCDERVEYRVRANQGARYSRLSDPFTFFTDRCVHAADLTVVFHPLQIGPVNDTGELDIRGFPTTDHVLDVCGNIFATATGGTMSPEISTMRCGFGAHVAEGSHPWSSFDLDSGSVFRSRISDDRFKLTVGVVLNDLDTWGGLFVVDSTEWCTPSLTLPTGVSSHTILEWSRLDETYTLRGGTAEASCAIDVHVVGAPVTP